MRKLIFIGSIILLSTPALGQSYNGPSAEETRDAGRDGVQDALQDSAADMRGLSAQGL
jgi:hypothetical protein